MSRVFVAEEQRLERQVVINVLSPELAQGISVERFEREIQARLGRGPLAFTWSPTSALPRPSVGRAR